MGEVKKIRLEKLVIAFIYKNIDIFNEAIKKLKEKFGDIDFYSEELDFIHTDYYNKEIGENLKRKFISFKNLVNPENLSDIKLHTNEIEKMFLYPGTNKRQINIDPGLLSLSKFILATTKDYSHRIYIGKGIFAEVTLHFRNKQFIPFEWTYPDYATEKYRKILKEIREIYKRDISKMAE